MDWDHALYRYSWFPDNVYYCFSDPQSFLDLLMLYAKTKIVNMVKVKPAKHQHVRIVIENMLACGN